MNAVIEKLANLTYELVGIFLPGIVAIALAALMAATWSLGRGPSPKEFASKVESVADAPSSQAVAAAAVGIAAYFAGHFLLWFSRDGLLGLLQAVAPRVRRAHRTKAPPSGGTAPPQGSASAAQPRKRGWCRRLFTYLCEIGRALELPAALRFLFLLGAPREKGVPQELTETYTAALRWLSAGEASVAQEADREWRVFYLLSTKAVLQSFPRSLVETYRNKYTLHRSLATLAAMGFWAELLSVLQVLRRGDRDFAPFLWPLGVLAVLVIVFSASYGTYWRLLGETVVAEAFELARVARKRDAM